MNLLNWILRRRAIDRDLDAEITQHFRMAIAERVAGGEDPESARLAALNEFGNVRKGGIIAIGIEPGDALIEVKLTRGSIVENNEVKDPGDDVVLVKLSYWIGR